jgi:hypothetical protein
MISVVPDEPTCAELLWLKAFVTRVVKQPIKCVGTDNHCATRFVLTDFSWRFASRLNESLSVLAFASTRH